MITKPIKTGNAIDHNLFKISGDGYRAKCCKFRKGIGKGEKKDKTRIGTDLAYWLGIVEATFERTIFFPRFYPNYVN